MDQRTGRSPARFLAPLALIVFAIVFLTIISGSGGNGSSSNSSSSTNTVPTTAGSTTTKSSSSAKKKKTSRSKASGPSVYTVKVGDTLGGIAGKTGVPLSKIQELNPNVDPHAMVAGQQLKIR